MQVKVENGTVTVNRPSDQDQHCAPHGLTRGRPHCQHGRGRKRSIRLSVLPAHSRLRLPTKDTSGKQNRESRGQTGAAAGQTPQNDGKANDEPAGDPIGKETKNRCADHVSDEKGVTEKTCFGHGVYIIRREESCSNFRFERGQNLPVDIVEKIDRQGGGRVRCARRYGF